MLKIVRDHHDKEPEGHGSVYHAEGQILAALAAALGGPVLEIGTCRGISAGYILDGLSPHYALVSCDVAHQLPGPMAANHLLVHGTARDAPRLRYAWAFIDGDHSLEGVEADIRECRCRDIPILVFHDTGPHLANQLRNGVPEDGAAEATQAIIDRGNTMVELGTKAGLRIWRVGS